MVGEGEKMWVVSSDSRPISIQHSSFKDRFFLGIKKISYQEISQTIFGSRLIKQVRSGDGGINILNLISRGWHSCLYCTPPSLLTPITMTTPYT